ncbi:mitochondrial dynamin GTPase Msp1, partial [Linderina macrospora]
KTPRLTKSDSSSTDSDSKNGRSTPAANEWNAEDDAFWDHRLSRASAQLTKSGVGRWTTQMVVNLLMDSVASMVDGEPFSHHPETRNAVLNFSHEILRSKYHSTVDQVENTIKPFKYEVEVEPHEWKKAQRRSSSLLDNEIRLCRQSLAEIRSSTPKKQLQQAIQFVRSAEKSGIDPVSVQIEIARRNAEHNSADRTDSPSEPLSAASADVAAVPDAGADAAAPADDLGFAQFSPRLVRRAQQALMLQDRLAILHLRKKALNSSACASMDNKRFCPEVFLDVVAEKLAYNAVLFINFELLHDFFFQFPRELDSNLYYGKTLEQTRSFASQNPKIGRQLALLERRAKLELVMARLHDLVRQQTAAEEQATPLRSVRRGGRAGFRPFDEF